MEIKGKKTRNLGILLIIVDAILWILIFIFGVILYQNYASQTMAYNFAFLSMIAMFILFVAPIIAYIGHKKYEKSKIIISILPFFDEGRESNEILINRIAMKTGIKPLKIKSGIKFLVNERYIQGIFQGDDCFMIKEDDHNKDYPYELKGPEGNLKNNQTQEEKYNILKENLKTVNNKIKTLTDKLTNGEISSQAFTKANDNLEKDKKEIEEELWKLRNELFKDDYEKPF